MVMRQEHFPEEGCLSQAWKCGCANEWFRVADGVFKRTEGVVWMGTKEKSQKEQCSVP